MTLSVVFMGTPDFSVPALEALLAAGHDVRAVYSQPPRPAGRGMKERRSPVHGRAEGAGLAVHTPTSLKPAETQARFRRYDADVAVVVAYGLLLPPPVLVAPQHGCLNIHASLLPRWRGAAPINRAIMAGDRETGVAIMRMEEGLDTGPVALCERLTIEPDETAGELHDRLAVLGAELIVRALRGLEGGELSFTPQSEDGVTYARKIDKSETRIDWTRPAARVHDHIRGLSPFPGAWCEMPFGDQKDRIKVLRSEIGTGNGAPGTVLDDALTVACGDGAVRLVTLQRAGKQALGRAEFLRGHAVAPGTVLE